MDCTKLRYFCLDFTGDFGQLRVTDHLMEWYIVRNRHSSWLKESLIQPDTHNITPFLDSSTTCILQIGNFMQTSSEQSDANMPLKLDEESEPDLSTSSRDNKAKRAISIPGVRALHSHRGYNVVGDTPEETAREYRFPETPSMCDYGMHPLRLVVFWLPNHGQFGPGH